MPALRFPQSLSAGMGIGTATALVPVFLVAAVVGYAGDQSAPTLPGQQPAEKALPQSSFQSPAGKRPTTPAPGTPRPENNAADRDRTRQAAQIEFFEKHVRPVLAEHCYSCHGPKKQNAGLRLDTTAGLRAGGDSGPVIIPGQPEKSLLLRAVRRETDSPMPWAPSGPSRWGFSTTMASSSRGISARVGRG